MDRWHYALFHGFLGRECVFALMARDEMARLLPNYFRRGMTPEESISQTNSVWFSIDAFLMATGNISKTLWPPMPKNPTVESERNRVRGEDLRSILDVSDDSPFRSRQLRNSFEHFDKELDKWFFKERHESIVVDSAIMPLFQIAITESILPAKAFRVFDRDSWTLYCLGKTLSFRAVIGAVETLQTSLAEHLPGNEGASVT